MIEGIAAEWLASRRNELNRRFERTRHRHPLLSPDAVLAALSEILPPLAGPDPRCGDLLSSVYDLVLLHAARSTFASRPWIGCLLKDVFPKIRHLLLQKPATLPAALSNAVENMGTRGARFVDGLRRLAECVDDADLLVDAGVLLAWRAGEARLRRSALATAERLPGRVVLATLELHDLPPAAAPVVLDALRADGWHEPRRLLSDRTLETLQQASPSEVEALRKVVAQVPEIPLGQWRVVGRVGDFSGFGGTFDVPPLVLDGGDRHVLYTRCGAQDFRIDADAFGWVCRPHSRLDLPVRSVAAPSKFGRMVTRLTMSSRAAVMLLADGTLTVGKESARLGALAASSSFALLPALVAAARSDSHRITIVAPEREAV